MWGTLLIPETSQDQVLQEIEFDVGMGQVEWVHVGYSAKVWMGTAWGRPLRILYGKN